MTDRELELWVEYKKGITERNAVGWEKTHKDNQQLREEHNQRGIANHEMGKRLAREHSELFGVPYHEPWPSFSMAPYFLFVGEHTTYEGFLDYLVTNANEDSAPPSTT